MRSISAPGLFQANNEQAWKEGTNIRTALRVQPEATRGAVISMIKGVCDFLEANKTLQTLTDYALCAATVVHQAMLLQPKSPASILMMASMHELETLRALLESAIAQVQMPSEPRTMH